MEIENRQSFVARLGGPTGLISLGYAAFPIGASGLMWMLFTYVMPTLIPEWDPRPTATIQWASSILASIGIVFFCLFLLWLMWPRTARIVSGVLSVPMIVWFPMGTAYAAAWFWFVYRKRRTRSGPSEPD